MRKSLEPVEIQGFFVELLGRFELPTSSLPILFLLFFAVPICCSLSPCNQGISRLSGFCSCSLLYPVDRSRMGFVWVSEKAHTVSAYSFGAPANHITARGQGAFPGLFFANTPYTIQQSPALI